MSHIKPLPLLLIASCVLFINWSTQETISGGSKPTINFYGKLKTQQGNAYSIENITVDHLFKQIPLYEVPTPASLEAQDETKNGQNNDKQTGIRLATSPINGIITKIDLSETSEIRVLEPEKVYFFQRKKGYRTLEFIEIEIISADQEKTKHTYLIEADRKIYCDEINPAGPIEKEVPVQAIKSLEIEGYHFRDTLKKAETQGSRTTNQA